VSDIASPALPRFGTVFVEQVRVVGLAVRRAAALLAALLAVVAVLVLIDMADSSEAANAIPTPPLVMIALGALSPFAVWKGERVFDGGHLWTLPFPRQRHALIKVAAGGLWLLVAVAAIQLWIIALAAVTGGDIGVHGTRMLMGPGGPSDVTPVAWSTQAWEWVVPFTTALTCYLIGSAFMLGVKYPLRWGTLAVAAFIALGLIAEEGLMGGLPGRLFDTVVESALGMNEAVGGGEATETDQLTGGRDVIGPEVLVLWTRLPALERWAPAALFWLALGGGALWVAASRHRED